MTVQAPIDTVGAFVGDPAVLLEGRPGQPLSGTSLGVKDLFDVAGTVTRAGNPIFAEGRPPATHSAAAVARLVDGGATVVGRTITDELAYSLSGTNVHDGMPRNVAAPGRVPGGSSAGSAAAVAAGLIDLGLGTDTGGSIRVPASYCGIWGWRPTHGRIPLDGVIPLAPSFDTVGLLARDIDVLVDAASVLLGELTIDEAGDVRVLSIAEAMRDSDPVVATEVTRVVRWLGGTDQELELDVDLGAALTAFRIRQGWEAWAEHGDWIRANDPRFGRGVAARFEAAAAIGPDELAPADAVRTRVAARLADATADGTLLALPAAAGGAPTPSPDPTTHELTRARTLRLTCLAGLAGAPVVVLPLAHHDGLPLGVALIGAPGSDMALLAAASGMWRRAAGQAMSG